MIFHLSTDFSTSMRVLILALQTIRYACFKVNNKHLKTIKHMRKVLYQINTIELVWFPRLLFILSSETAPSETCKPSQLKTEKNLIY